MINVSYFKAFVKKLGAKPGKFIPLGHNSKVPVAYNWTGSEMTADQLKDAIKSSYNIGVKLDDTDLIVDFDLKNLEGDSKRKDIYFKRFVEEYGLQDALTVRTVSGGYHIYLKKDPNIKIYRYKKDKWSNIVEFKSKGAQVVAPGSNVGGATYEICVDGSRKLAPKTLLDLIEKKLTKNVGPVEADLDEIKTHLDRIKPGDHQDYDSWLKIGQAVHAGSGGSDEGLELFVQWCRKDPAYDNDKSEWEVRHKWSTFCSSGGINFNYLKKVIYDSGALVPRDMAKKDFADVKAVEGEIVAEDEELVKLDMAMQRDQNQQIKNTTVNAGKIMRFYLKRLGIYYDVCDNIIKFKKLPPWSEHSMSWNDRHAKALHEYISIQFYELSETKFQSALLAAMAMDEFQIHPIQEYLKDLKWDGDSRVDTWLTDYAGCADTLYTREVSRYIMRALVKRAFMPGCKVDYMPIFEGAQGSGKSWLCQSIGGVWSSDEDPFSIQNPRDRAMILEGKWVVEIPELSSFARRDPNHLKAFITKTHDRVRRAYGRETEDLGRGCVFIGTTNDKFYLQDKTGNRRFLPVYTGEIDVRGFEAVRDQLFAEAVAEFRKYGKNLDLTFSKEATISAKDLQESRRVVSAFEEDVMAFIHTQIEKGDTFISNDRLKREIWKYHRNRPISHQTVGHFFERVGWVYIRTKSQRGYSKPG